jgi:hypothetical protein
MTQKQQPIYVSPQQLRQESDRRDKPSGATEKKTDPVLTLAKAWGIGKVA